MRLLRPLRVVGLALLIVLVVGGLIGYWALRASLPKLDGNISDARISAPATIERDAEGRIWVGGDAVTCVDGSVTL